MNSIRLVGCWDISPPKHELKSERWATLPIATVKPMSMVQAVRIPQAHMQRAKWVRKNSHLTRVATKLPAQAVK